MELMIERSMDHILLQIYHLSPLQLVCWCLVILGGVFLLHRRFSHRRWWRLLSGMVLLLWAVAVLYITVLSRSSGIRGSFQLVPLHSYRQVLATRNPELLRSCFMNALLFYPAGVLGAMLLPRTRRSILWLVLGAALFSLAIELLQFHLHLGNGEIDDILHNTLGAWLGAYGPHCFRQKKTDHPAG